MCIWRTSPGSSDKLTACEIETTLIVRILCYEIKVFSCWYQPSCCTARQWTKHLYILGRKKFRIQNQLLDLGTRLILSTPSWPLTFNFWKHEYWLGLLEYAKQCSGLVASIINPFVCVSSWSQSVILTFWVDKADQGVIVAHRVTKHKVNSVSMLEKLQ